MNGQKLSVFDTSVSPGIRISVKLNRKLRHNPVNGLKMGPQFL